jgi:hypothetical protein
VLAAFAVAVIALVVFLAAQARGAHPMVPLNLFRSRTVTVSVTVGFAFIVGYYGLPFVMSLYLQQLRGLSPLATGAVFLIGEDVGQFGGAFKVTKGFLEKFGQRRVVDTPIAESGFTGLAAGAALYGLRPVVEYQFADFISCAFDQIINVLARHYYRTGDPMPVTLRCPYGARLRAGPTHSQSIESYFAHVPGLKIVAPATVEDAAGLLRAAVRDNNPVFVSGEQVPVPADPGAGADLVGSGADRAGTGGPPRGPGQFVDLRAGGAPGAGGGRDPSGGGDLRGGG